MKRAGLIIGSIIAIAIIAGAAFVAARMLSTPEQAEASSPGEGSGTRVMEIVLDEGDGPFALRITFEPAPELPARPAETAGIVTKQEGNSFFVGTGEIEVDVEVEGDSGQETWTTNHSGPEVEVLVSPETIIYKDVTEMDFRPSARLNGEMTVQQVVKAVSSVEEIDESSELQVWGERRGDQVMAAVLVYRQAGY